MKQQDVFKKIGVILKELNEQYDYLKDDPTDLNELELELFVANSNFLKDHSEILYKLTVQSAAQAKALPAHVEPVAPAVAQAPEEPAKVIQVILTPPPPVEVVPPVLPPPPPVVQQAPPIAEPKPEPVAPISPPAPEKAEHVYEQRFFEPVVQQVKPVIEDKPEEAEPAIESEAPKPIRHELIVDDAEVEAWEKEDDEVYEQEEDIEEEAPIVTPVARITEPEPEPVVKVEPVYVAPLAPVAIPEVVIQQVITSVDSRGDAEPVTINQRISVQMAEKSAPVQQPISDLKSAITLNDKLLFVKDLFNGYSLAYSEAVEILNRFNNFEEAERFLNSNYVAKNNWDAKPQTSEKFFNLLRRRYAN
ncbi:hypothetical protein GCM10023149_50840 [Mucilaginibacter gynuensis]|uniref:Uncharacterized protein n=1 Tax=Mucilaginibacter gynuensis TaxID=1302236 RepID=A0ABP8HIK4_9SPHI